MTRRAGWLVRGQAPPIRHVETRPPFDALTAVLAGLLAGAVFVVVLEADLRLTGRNVDDLTLLGGPFLREPRRARAAGAAIHAVNSVALAALYTRLADRLPGPPWLRGVLFANVENGLLYPLTAFEDRQPAIRDGRLDRYWSWSAFLQSIPRHVAYGVALGSVYHRLRRD